MDSPRQKLGYLPGFQAGTVGVDQPDCVGDQSRSGKTVSVPPQQDLRTLLIKGLLILILWGGEFSFLYIIGAQLHPLPKHSVVAEMESSAFSSRFGPIRCIRRDPENSHRLVYAISLADITADSGSVSVFKTGLFKTVHVRSLRLCRFVYGTNPLSDRSGVSSFLSAWPPGETVRGLQVVWDLIGDRKETLRLGNGIEVCIDRPDFSDASQLIIDDFDFRIVAEGQSSLSITSKRASASYEDSGILLRGGVAITAEDGAVLRANRVLWDPKRGSFTVEGNYLLSRGDTQTAGRAICLDEKLREYQDDNHPNSEDPHYVLR